MAFVMYEEYYKIVLNRIIDANKKHDFEWFHNKTNRYDCRRIISYWNGRYSLCKELKYKNAIRKLAHILRMAQTSRKWEQYLIELK